MVNILLFLAGALYFLGLSWGSTLGFWLSVEAAGLVLVSGFFNYSSSFNRYISLLYYLLVSGLSSALFFSGILSSAFNLLFVLAAVVKGGVFPFIGWVLLVYSNCGWSLLFFLAVLSKVIFLYFPLIVGEVGEWVLILCCISFVVCSVSFWLSSFSMKSFLGISSVGSTCTLLISLFFVGVHAGAYLYLFYLLISSVVFYVIYLLENGSLKSLGVLWSFFIIVAIPCSLMFIYKFLSVTMLSGLPILVLISWVLFSISEQMYLCFILLEKSSSSLIL